MAFVTGGLPPFFLTSSLPEREFQEWMDAYWAKDIQELFRLERRYSFLRFTELPSSGNQGYNFGVLGGVLPVWLMPG
jgi:hypothetical protein